MAIEHNYDQFARAFDEKRGAIKSEVLRPVARFTNVRFGALATDKYMREGGATFTEGSTLGPNRQTGTGTLRRDKGTLTQAVNSSFKDGKRRGQIDVAITANGLTWTKVIGVGDDLNYAAIHEFGGTIEIPVTEKMRGFFWAKYYEAGGGSEDFETAQGATTAAHWKGLALGAQKHSSFTIEMPARPYARPAMADAEPEIQQKTSDLFFDLMNSL
jgi:phage gpG-like protein